MVKPQLPKLMLRVRFPLLAPIAVPTAVWRSAHVSVKQDGDAAHGISVLLFAI